MKTSDEYNVVERISSGRTEDFRLAAEEITVKPASMTACDKDAEEPTKGS